MRKLKHNDLNIKDRLFSEQNIYLALYSVDSYISNKELLSKRDREELIKLRDKFDEKNIKKWIKIVKERLHSSIN